MEHDCAMDRARRLCAALAVLAITASTARAQQEALTLYDSPQTAQPAGPIDRAVFARLESLGIRPVLCSDAAFVRRVHLDVTGTLPSAEEARQFIDDTSPGKRAALIDRLLETEAHATYFAMRWSDVLRIKAEFPINLWPNAAQAYHHWVRTSVAENTPYDQMVRELLTSSGSNFRVGPVNFYRAIQNRTPEGIAGAVALTFMGERADRWPADRLQGLAACFSQVGYKPTREWKEEIVYWDPFHVPQVAANVAAEKPAEAASAAPPPVPAAPQALTTTLPDGSKLTVPPDRDPREAFADWLVRPDNPHFTRAIANRSWYWLLGRGVIQEPDDIRDDNPPSNPELLAALEQILRDSHFDLKHLYRSILNSATYQLSCVPRSDRPEAEAAFASYRVRRIEAEVLIDMLNEITGTSELYTSPIPEPFTYIPRDLPAVAIADGSITSPFLTLFGRSARATGMENERIANPVPAQWLNLLNSSQIQRKLEQGPGLRAVLEQKKDRKQVVEDLYLTILSRRPTNDELQTVAAHVRSATSPREAAIDLAWALVNSPEFLYRH
jgi:hypothetical protein